MQLPIARLSFQIAEDIATLGHSPALLSELEMVIKWLSGDDATTGIHRPQMLGCQRLRSNFLT